MRERKLVDITKRSFLREEEEVGMEGGGGSRVEISVHMMWFLLLAPGHA